MPARIQASKVKVTIGGQSFEGSDVLEFKDVKEAERAFGKPAAFSITGTLSFAENEFFTRALEGITAQTYVVRYRDRHARAFFAWVRRGVGHRARELKSLQRAGFDLTFERNGRLPKKPYPAGEWKTRG